ncbi:MAG: M36 family metallopeptidase, partial [Acidobacteriota bacterium]
VIQQFWIMNWYHDELYRLGFTEAARNFQTDNFSRGGLGADRISAQGQDFTGVNNANFSTAADGVRGKMQMYVWNGADPDRDGTTDAEIMIHEATHGTSNRLHGNSSGLSTNMSRGMGEGWSDFYASSLLSEPSDPIGGIYTIGGYALYQGYAGTIGTKNYYYGIRRFPKAIISSVGANGKPHNPLTFADLDSTQLNTSDGAFAQMTGPHISGTADQVHAAGEIWSVALWEVRARLVQRLGWSDGNRRALQLVTDGMKLAPIGPDFLQERDAIIAAALGSSPSAAQIADVTDVWAGFAARGMGFGASIQSTGSGVGDARVTQAFDVPGLIQAPKLTISDSLGDNDGIFEPGENLRLTVPLSNVSGVTASNVFVQITGGGSAAYGAVSAAGTASQIITFKIPNAIACGAQINLIFTVSSSLGNSFFTVPIAVGAPNITYFESFDGVNAPAFPGGWTATSISGGINFVTSTNGADTPPNVAFAVDPPTVGGGTDLTSPSILISAQAATVSFRNFYDTEPGFDGGVLEISIGAGPFQDIVSAGGSFIQNGYNGLIHPSSANNPLAGKLGWTGNSKTYLTTIARLPTNASGQLVRFRWRFGADTNTGVTGWKVDQLQVAGSFLCSFTPVNTIKSRADFDFDGKTDLSVWRPSDGNWYVFRSGGGITAIVWGIATDTPVPGDFDGDSKADMTVFRPTDAPFATFYTLNSNGFTVTSTTFGIAGDTPLTGDFDGDSKTDVAVFRSSTNTWYIKGSNGGGSYSTTLFGEAGDIPVPADYNGDTKTDIAVWRPSTGQWFVINSGAGFTATAWGALGDRPVPADYNGDDKDDLAVYRPSDGKWYLFMNGTTLQTIPWGGTAGDIPVPGDYDGDGRDDAAIYRGGTWYVLQSGGGITGTNWGVASDIPILSKYTP